MTAHETLPKLITFDGEARSGKGTIAHFIKRSLQDEGLKVMLIDRGQIFRSLVVSATRNKVDLTDVTAIDTFLANKPSIDATIQIIKTIYHMDHATRDALLYTKEVGENSARIGARPASQAFARTLTKKWIHDANNEGYDIILMDGRALESLACEAESEQSANYVLGMYFVCDPLVGARRTLGYHGKEYDALSAAERIEVDELVAQINTRNNADMTREVERVVEPMNATRITLPASVPDSNSENRMLIIDTSASMTKDEMSKPVLQYVRISISH